MMSVIDNGDNRDISSSDLLEIARCSSVMIAKPPGEEEVVVKGTEAERYFMIVQGEVQVSGPKCDIVRTNC